MAIQLRIATSLDTLSAELTDDLRKEQIGVFDKQWVITQTDGINNWLRQQLATSNGIAANLQFAKMNEVMQLLYYWLCPGSPLMMDKDRMTWAIFAELQTPEFCERFPAIADYYADSESRRAALAAEMADLFDQYQVYRHEKIAAWKKEEEQEADTDIWQVYLWRKMKTRLGKDFSDKLDVSFNILQRLEDPEAANLIRKRLPALRFFGLAIVTPYYLELFRVLSDIIDIKFYLLNPSPEELWMDDVSDKRIATLRKRPEWFEHRKTGNELLVNWGSVLRESYHLLLSNDTYVNIYEVVPSDIDSKKPGTLLEHIQWEIRNNLSNAERGDIPSAFLKDDSITVNGCYTPVREVEVLYNYLLEVFSKDPSLHARDIVVMMSNVDLYAPYIKAVFDNAPIQIPYSIADESVSGGNSLFTAIKDILLLDAEVFKAEEVLSLLESPYIRRRFGFRDIDNVRQAVREAGIFFGKGTSDAEDTLYESTEAWMVSWEYGLQKIMYGLCMSGEELYEGATRPLYPLDTAEGASMTDRIRLYHFIQVLQGLLAERNQNKTLAQWSEYLGKLMSEMILEDDEEDEDFPRFAKLKECITALDEFSEGAHIQYITFLQIFMSRLDMEKRSNRYAGKGVNFCSMVPMRSVPYKIIGLLGMDFDKFPRQDSALSFSLIGKEKRPGDRSIRENDNHLFLETLLAARSKLYISYLARDVNAGSDKPPSSLVDELLDYIAFKSTHESAYKKQKVHVHPLHLFSKKYWDKGTGLPPNYLGNTLVEGESFRKSDQPQREETDLSAISIDDLAAFFKHPVKYYFNKTYNIYYFNKEEQIPDTELFELNKLQEWKIKDEWLNTSPDPLTYTDKAKKRGLLPLANMGEIIFSDIKEIITPFEEEIRFLKNGNLPERIPVYLRLEDTVIEGHLPVYGNLFIVCSISSKSLRDMMDAWVRYLVALAQNDYPALEFAFVFSKKDLPCTIRFAAGEISQAEAMRIVQQLVAYFKDGLQRPFPFHPLLAHYFFTPSIPDPGFVWLTPEGLMQEYEKEKNDSFNPSKKLAGDNYLEKVIELKDEVNQYFSPASVNEMNRILPELMGKIFEKCPVLFK